MALLFMEGFGGGDVAFKWDPTSGTYSTQSASPRIAGCYYGDVPSGSTLLKSVVASNRLFFGAGFFQSANVIDIGFYGDAGVTRHITIYRNGTTGLLEIRRGTSAGTLLATGTTPIIPSVWNYIEVSCTVSDTIGEVHVRLNGSPTDEVSYTGDTKNAGTATTLDKVSVYMGGAGGTQKLSDLYILNDTGSAPNNTFLGDVVVRTLSPAGNGTYSQLLGSDADSVNNYLLVDEHPYSGTDYTGSATTGQKDAYAMADLPAGVSTVYGVQLNGFMAKSDASFAQSRLLLRSGGTDYGGTTRILSTSFQGYYELYPQDPATSAQWTPANVNNIESGMEVM